ncbi:MAG: hypothetical protein ACOC22_01590 [bacterium]
MLDSKKDDFQTIIFFNEDLDEEYKHWKINYIKYDHFKTASREVVRKASLVLYVDRETLQTKILKNRWGNDGGVA